MDANTVGAITSAAVVPGRPTMRGVRMSPEDLSQDHADASAALSAESLIEEVSIDGMCGVY
jgi:mycofactocin precursor